MTQRATDFSVGETIYFNDFVTGDEASGVVLEVFEHTNTLVIEPEEWVGAEKAWIPLDRIAVRRSPALK